MIYLVVLKVGESMKKFLELLFFKQIKGVGNASINKKYINIIKDANDIDECISKLNDEIHKIDSDLLEEAKQLALEKFNQISQDEAVTVITIYDDEYPKQFLDLGNKRPVILYAKGNTSILKEKSIAIVGTRTPSIWSQKLIDKLVKKIIELTDIAIVSGLALGCDSIAHQSTLEVKGKTIAILPSGVNVITPSAHNDLAINILDNGGCLVSEYEPNEEAKLSTYVVRDGLIAALAISTFVIECDVKSGTMNTVDAAEKMNRNIACVYTENKEKGNFEGNKYILENKKSIKITGIEELKEYLHNIDNKKKKNGQLSFWDM